MRKLKMALAVFTLIGSLAFANFNDLPRDHWAYDSVKNLYNKGLLTPTLDDAQNFNGDAVFSRYEIASMLYFNVKYFDEKIAQKASQEDITALKALIENFAPELSKMGAKIEDVNKKIADVEKNVEKKLGKKVEKLEEKINAVRISGNFDATQTIGMKKNAPGMENLEYAGDIFITGNTSENISTKVRLETKLEEDATDNLIKLKSIEGRFKSEALTLSVFRDDDKSVPDFEDTFNMFSGSGVDPDQGVFLSGNYNLVGNANKYMVMFFKAGEDDFYGIQTKQNLDMLKSKGMNAFVRASYVEKVTKYQWDVDEDKESLAADDDAKGLYGIDGELAFKPLSILDMKVAMEYAARRSPGDVVEIESDAIDYLPVIGSMIGSREAMYLYTSGTLKGALQGLTFAGGLYNSGEYFDTKNIGNDAKPVFAETSLVQVGSDKKAVMGKLGYNVLGKGMLLADVTYSSYGSNAKDTFAAERIQTNVILNAIPNKVRMELGITIDKEERKPENMEKDDSLELEAKYLVPDYGDVKSYDVVLDYNELEAEKGMFTLEQKNTIDLLSNASQTVAFTYQDNLDKDDAEDSDKFFKFSLGNDMQVTPTIKWNAGLSYKNTGLGMKNYIEIQNPKDATNLAKNMVFQNKEHDKYTEFDLGTGAEIDLAKFGKINTGLFFHKKDQKGGVVGTAVKVTKDGTTTVTANAGVKDTTNEKDEQTTSLFAAHAISFGKLKVVYGLKYLDEKVGCDVDKDGKEYIENQEVEVMALEGNKLSKEKVTTDVKVWKFRDKEKSEGGEYDILYAVGLQYDFGNDTVAAFTYGDTTIPQDDKNPILNKTTFANGEQDQFTFAVSTKF